MKKSLSVLAGISIVGASLAGAGAALAAEEMRCSHQLPPTHHIAIVIDRWAEEAGEDGAHLLELVSNIAE